MTWAPQHRDLVGSGTVIRWSIRAGTGRDARSPYCAPGLRPGGLGVGFGSPLENGAACRLRERNASSSSLRSRSFSASTLSSWSRRDSFSFSSFSILSGWRLSLSALIQPTVTETGGFVHRDVKQIRNHKVGDAVNNYAAFSYRGPGRNSPPLLRC